MEINLKDKEKCGKESHSFDFASFRRRDFPNAFLIWQAISVRAGVRGWHDQGRRAGIR